MTLDTTMSEFDRYFEGQFGGEIINTESHPIMEGGGTSDVVEGNLNNAWHRNFSLNHI